MVWPNVLGISADVGRNAIRRSRTFWQECKDSQREGDPFARPTVRFVIARAGRGLLYLLLYSFAPSSILTRWRLIMPAGPSLAVCCSAYVVT
jgi:hypothetical protein